MAVGGMDVPERNRNILNISHLSASTNSLQAPRWSRAAEKKMTLFFRISDSVTTYKLNAYFICMHYCVAVLFV